MTPRIFVIVIASFDKPIYVEFIKFRKLQFKQYGIPHLFVYDTEPADNFVCDDHDFIFKRYPVSEYLDIVHPEYNPHMILKFLHALHRIPTRYDYVIRVNLSTFINFPLMLNHLSSSPRTAYAAGRNVCIALPDWCLSNRPDDVIDFISGTCMIFSQDVVDLLKTISLGSPLLYTHNDDVILSHFIKKHGIPFYHMDMYCIENDKTPLPTQPVMMIRIKHENNREHLDVMCWKKLLELDGINTFEDG